MSLKLHPVKYWVVPNWFVSYGIENGRVFIRRRALLGYSRGGEHVQAENVSRIWATGKFVGDVHFGEGSHTPVVWRDVSNPQQLRDAAEAAVEKEKGRASGAEGQHEFSRERTTRLLVSAKSTRSAGFGDLADQTSVEAVTERIADTAWTINGDGTVTNHDAKTMWIQGAWGQVWNGQSFTGDCIQVSWDEAIRLFGRGANAAYPGRTQVSDNPCEWEETAFSRGYERGICTVTFAGYSDWRLPTAQETCLLSISQVDGPDVDAYQRLFPCNLNGFISASGGATIFHPLKLKRVASFCWMGSMGMAPYDDHPGIPYPILFCRDL